MIKEGEFINKKGFIEAILKALFLMSIEIFYIKIFGKSNIIIGILLGIATVSFLNRDFTGQIIYRTTTFLTINIYLTIAAYFTTFNVYTALIINFITIFIVTYAYMNDYRHPTSYIFLMVYVFMVSIKINLNQLPARLLAVCTGVIIIIFSQIVFNRKKFEKKSTNIIKSIIKEILEEIDDLIGDNYKEAKSIKINEKIRTLIICINEKSHKGFKKNKYELNQFNIAICLSRLNVIINHVVRCKVDKDKKDDYLKNLKIQISNIDNFNDGLENIEVLNKQIDQFTDRYEKLGQKLNFIDESIYVLKIFIKSITVEEKCNYTILNEIYSNLNIPKAFNIFQSMKANFNIKSLRFRYSIRLAIAISILIFFTTIINIQHSVWIILSTYVVLQPYQEDGVIKAKKRFLGVTIGAAIFFITFSIIRGYIPVTIILFIVFIGYFYFTDYSKKVIMTTILSLSSISLVENIDRISASRFLFVSIGILIGLLFNKYFLPYNIKDSIRDLKDKYKKNTKAILRELNYIIKGKNDIGKLIHLSMDRNKIENKLILNCNKINREDLQKFVYEQSMKMSDDKYILLKYFYKKYYVDMD